MEDLSTPTVGLNMRRHRSNMRDQKLSQLPLDLTVIILYMYSTIYMCSAKFLRAVNFVDFTVFEDLPNYFHENLVITVQNLLKIESIK